MDKRLQKLNNSQMVSGVALFSTAALSVYSIKNIIEINRKLDDIFEDMEKIKHFVTDPRKYWHLFRKINIYILFRDIRKRDLRHPPGCPSPRIS